MNEVEVTWGRATKVWWSLVWRGVLIGAVAGFIAGFIVGLLGFGEYGGVAGALAGIPVGIWVVKIIIGTKYSHFRIALVSTSEA